MSDKRQLSVTYTNTNDTASGSDELIVELMKKLIGLTDQHIIQEVTVNVVYHSPVDQIDPPAVDSITTQTDSNVVEPSPEFMKEWISKTLPEEFKEHEVISIRDFYPYLETFTDVYQRCMNLKHRGPMRQPYQLNKCMHALEIPMAVVWTDRDRKHITLKKLINLGGGVYV